MNTVEEQVRAALKAQAETFSAHPDASRHLVRRSQAVAKHRLAPAWPARFFVPLAAAAAVVAVVVVATLLVNGVSGRTGSAGAVRSALAQQSSPAVPRNLGRGYPSSGPASEMLLTDPPTSAVIALPVLWTGPKGKKANTVSYFWVGQASPAYWPDQINQGPQFCHDTVNVTSGESAGFCWPLPRLGAGHLALVTGREGVGTNQAILVGAAAAQVTSVTAVLPDGRGYVGVVKTGRGFADRAWTVGFPLDQGARLVFRDASGNQVATLATAGPIGPQQVAQPKSGGVRVYSYPASAGEPAGQVDAYLIDGRVGFWSPIWGGTISQAAAIDPPVLGGLTEPFGLVRGTRGDSWSQLRAFGYAHANVARVVLRETGGRQVSASMIAVSWPGLRLWTASLPMSTQQITSARIRVSATAYDAAGHVLGQVQLGGME